MMCSDCKACFVFDQCSHCTESLTNTTNGTSPYLVKSFFLSISKVGFIFWYVWFCQLSAFLHRKKVMLHWHFDEQWHMLINVFYQLTICATIQSISMFVLAHHVSSRTRLHFWCMAHWYALLHLMTFLDMHF